METWGTLFKLNFLLFQAYYVMPIWPDFDRLSETNPSKIITYITVCLGEIKYRTGLARKCGNLRCN